MKIGILGYGVVGKGVVRILEDRCQDFQIVHILVKEKEECKDDRFTTRVDVLLSDIDVLMEMIVGDMPAYDIILKALNRGIHVITSNKTTVAAHLSEYMDMAIQKRVQFRFEASVGGGIPWVQGCIKAKRIDAIQSLQGILNGTTNYILDTMLRDNISFTTCLKTAQQCGYAEADPTADIEGYDVQRKVMISSAIAFGGALQTEEFDRLGLSTIQLKDLAYFKSKGQKVKYMGAAFKQGNEIYGCVEPVLLDENNTFASVQKNYNMVELVGETIGTLQFIGQGAGQEPTANAMIQDLLDISDHRIDTIELNENLVMNKELFQFVYVVCSDNTMWMTDDFTQKEIVDGRAIGMTRRMTPKQRNEKLVEWKKFDENLLCLRSEVK